jgi:YVTN family beta-propeller protein
MSGSSHLQRPKATYAGLVAQRELMSVARQGGSDATVPEGSSGLDAARSQCRATAFVTNTYGDTVSTIDVKTKTKHPTDITVGTGPIGVAVTPCRR